MILIGIILTKILNNKLVFQKVMMEYSLSLLIFFGNNIDLLLLLRLMITLLISINHIKIKIKKVVTSN